jgi:hypothetical protein
LSSSSNSSSFSNSYDDDDDDDDDDEEDDDDDDNDAFVDCLPLPLILFLASGIFPPLPNGPLPLSRSFPFRILGLVLVFALLLVTWWCLHGAPLMRFPHDI